MDFGAVVGIAMNKSLFRRVVRFASAVLALLVLPIYGLTRLPFADTARLLTGLSVFIFCASGAAVFAWGVLQTVLLRSTREGHSGFLLGLVLLCECAGMLIVGGLMRATHLGPRIFLVVAVGALVAGGVWALGGFLQWLWSVTGLSYSGDGRGMRHAFCLKQTPLQRKGGARG